MPQILKKKWNIVIPREIRCCYFIAFENFYFHLLVRSSVRVYIGYTWTDQASPRKKFLAHRRWWPLANILLRMGLSPGRRALLFVWFLNVRPGTTPVTESTLFRGTTPNTGTTPVLFSQYFFFCALSIWKNKVGLIKTWAHVFLTNKYLTILLFTQVLISCNDIYTLVTTGTWHALVTSFSSLRMYNLHCMLTNLEPKQWTF